MDSGLKREPLRPGLGHLSRRKNRTLSSTHLCDVTGKYQVLDLGFPNTE